MDYQIIPVLDAAQTGRLLEALTKQPFVDGKATAQDNAQSVKNNLQAQRTDALAELERQVSSALYANGEFQAFAFPKRVRSPIFSRYEHGMNYGEHVDGSIMHEGNDPLRADLAVTVFLSPPDSYDGGELVISRTYGEEEIKLAAGEAVVYPASTVHRVAPVTRGVRTAAVTWVQSAVRDERMRALLFDLYLAMRKVEWRQDPTLLLSKTYHNLLRISAEF